MDSRSLAPTLSERTAVPARLIVVTPKDRFTRVLLRQTITIGRAADVDIRLLEEFVSGHQAKLEKEGETYRFIQQGKTNPTFYQGKPIESVLLQDGDILFIGTEKGPRISLQFEGAKSNSSQVTLSGQSGIQSQLQEGGRFLGAVTLDKKVILGRDPKNAIVLESMHISRQHAFVEPQGERHVLKDLGSTNGTYVNGERITERKLQEGDVIRIGHFKLIYQGNELRGYDEERAVRLDARQIAKQFDDATLLHDISLSVLPGELLGIVGTSGAGKSTLMDALNGVRPASKGVVLINGSDLYRQFDAIRPLLGYVPQFPTLHATLPLEKALFYSGRLRFPPDVEDEVVKQRSKDALHALEIGDRANVLVGRLSGGQQKRASIAAELLTEPGLFFLDEPASGLDPGLTRKFMEIIRKLADEGRTVILVTHDTESLSLCDVMVFLNQGRVIYIGSPKDAPAYFGVKNLGEIYSLVSSQKTSSDWESQYKSSPKFQEYVTARQENIPEVAVESQAVVTPVKAKARLSLWQQWKVLLRRYIDLWAGDLKTLAFFLLQAPIIAGLLCLVFDPSSMLVPPGLPVAAAKYLPPMFPPLPLLMAAAVTWFGTFAAVGELVKELPIFRRERLAGLRIFPYLMSKVSLLSVLCLAQAALFYLALSTMIDFHQGLPNIDPKALLGLEAKECADLLLSNLPQQSVATIVSPGVLMGPGLEIFLTLLLTNLTAMAMGLFVSAWSDNPDRALGSLPLLLIPQLIFAGIPADAHPILQWCSHLSIARWALEAMASTMGFGVALFPHESSYLISRWVGLFVIGLVFLGGAIWLLSRRKLA